MILVKSNLVALYAFARANDTHISGENVGVKSQAKSNRYRAVSLRSIRRSQAQCALAVL